jgi:hypothetical protein
VIRAGLAFGALLADGAAWALAVRSVGIGGESNPVAVALFAAGGLQAILAAKVVQAFLAATITHRLRGSRWSLLPAMVGLFGAATGIGAIIR